MKYNTGPWNEAEVKALKKHYPKGMERSKKAIPTRTAAAIKNKAMALGLVLCPKIAAKERSARAKLGNATKEANKQAEAGRVVPDEYIQASDIFQVGFRYFKQLGWGDAQAN